MALVSSLCRWTYFDILSNAKGKFLRFFQIITTIIRVPGLPLTAFSNHFLEHSDAFGFYLLHGGYLGTSKTFRISIFYGPLYDSSNV